MNEASDRVRAHTAAVVLRRIDDATHAGLLRCAAGPAEAATERLAQLDREWDTDRVLETEAATMGLLGLALGAWLKPHFLALPAFVAAAVLCHARTGRYPLMPVFRRLGLRTAREIARERYAVKALRGDFVGMDAPRPGDGRDAADAAEPREPGPAARTGVH